MLVAILPLQSKTGTFPEAVPVSKVATVPRPKLVLAVPAFAKSDKLLLTLRVVEANGYSTIVVAELAMNNLLVSVVKYGSPIVNQLTGRFASNHLFNII
jgi:hypothetical protein